MVSCMTIRMILDHFDNPTYSPNITPSDYDFFANIKIWNATQRKFRKRSLVLKECECGL